MTQRFLLLTCGLLGATFVSVSAVAAPDELLCTHGAAPVKGDTAACYSDAGCSFVASLGADPIRDFEQDSAPFALARGKITGIVTSSAPLIKKIKQVGGSCRKP